MVELNIEWDPSKAAANEKKHGISFDEAATVFSDENGRLIPDPDHSEEEEQVHSPWDELVPSNIGCLPLLSEGAQCHPDHLRSESDTKRAGSVWSTEKMRKNYDFSKGKKNPYASRLRSRLQSVSRKER